MLARARLLAIALLLASLVGCAGRNCCPQRSVEGSCFDCRDVQRSSLEPDVSQVLPLRAIRFSEPRLCGLSENEAQCLAARNSTTANLLEQEADASSSGPGALLHGSSSVGQVLVLAAADRRNEAAGNALEAFLRLLEAEAGADNLARRGREIDATLADIGRLQERGLLPPVPRATVEQQRLELWHRQAELLATIQKLNSQLGQLLGVSLLPESRFWPQASLTVVPTVPEANEAVCIALASRADLAAARLAAVADRKDRDALVRLLGQLAGGGFATAPQRGLTAVLACSAADSRADQLDGLEAERSRAVRQETLQAVTVLATRVTQIGLTRSRLEVAKDHLAATEQQQRSTAGSPSEVRKARLDVLAIEQDLLHDVVEWKLAVVKLKQAQGLLAVECGYDDGPRMASRLGRCR